MPVIRAIRAAFAEVNSSPDNTPAACSAPSFPNSSACEEAGFPVHTHSGEAPREEMGEHIGIYLAEVVWWTHRPIAHLLFSGAFGRFPQLKFVVTERPAVDSVRVLNGPGEDAELVHLASSRNDAEEWLSRHGYPRAVLQEVTADEAAADVVEGRAAA